MLLGYALWFSSKGECSPYCCLVVLPTRCLVDDSRLLGLTLRPSAPVCCCHLDSFRRLAFAQEAVRGPPPLAPRLVLHVMACDRWFQAASEKCLIKLC